LPQAGKTKLQSGVQPLPRPRAHLVREEKGRRGLEPHVLAGNADLGTQYPAQAVEHRAAQARTRPPLLPLPQDQRVELADGAPCQRLTVVELDAETALHTHQQIHTVEPHRAPPRSAPTVPYARTTFAAASSCGSGIVLISLAMMSSVLTPSASALNVVTMRWRSTG